MRVLGTTEDRFDWPDDNRNAPAAMVPGEQRSNASFDDSSLYTNLGFLVRVGIGFLALAVIGMCIVSFCGGSTPRRSSRRSSASRVSRRSGVERVSRRSNASRVSGAEAPVQGDEDVGSGENLAEGTVVNEEEHFLRPSELHIESDIDRPSRQF